MCYSIFFKLVTGTKSLMNSAICSGETFLDLSQLFLVNSWILHTFWQRPLISRTSWSSY